ncbi:unnamed protein product [Adineta steineri]|uniref:Uncharacterized protein n=1 Tax=Adineta steineri TaxID=433720 RepID=A0A814ZE74_9BILA|nr:unnamed protein product [Adineta steineri]CAF3495908.1 unnamed protein product [Adineta steineri]
MIIEKLIFFLLIPIINGHSSKSYYLIDIDTNLSSNETYCSNILTNEQIYRIPKQCQQHLLCDPYYCDDKSFRCIKIRETLCCLYKYFQSNCQQNNSNQIKDIFRSVYFQMSIEHGYCEINLERIEKNDEAYCIANINQDIQQPIQILTTTPPLIIESTTSRSLYKHFQRRPSSLRPNNRYRHRIATRQNYSSLANLNYLRQVTIIQEHTSSTCSINFLNCFLMFILLLSILI